MKVKHRIFDIVIGLMVFWIVTGFFSGIVINEGIIGIIFCGILYGGVMSVVVPLVKFFTLPVKFISIFLISIMLSVIIFFVYNLAVPFIDFLDGGVIGLSNSYFQLNAIRLSVMGNVLIGGLVTGFFQSLLKWLSHND